MSRLLAAATAVLLGSSGCAGSQSALPYPASTMPDDPVTRVAQLLAEADNPVASSTDRAGRVAALDSMGLRQADDSEDDPVSRWRTELNGNERAAAPLRGRALGPAYRSGWIEPGVNKSIDQLFLAGETARISLTNSARQPMALTISDPQSKVICQQEGSPPGNCKWVALYTQRYRIELSNRGKTRLRYFLVTN